MRGSWNVPTVLAAVLSLSLATEVAAAPERVKVLFLGDKGHHQPAARFRQIEPVLKARGIDATYTENAKDLNPVNLGSYDALILYANIDAIEPSEERALLDYVAGGKGFVPLHCASYCFRNAPEVVALIGAQFDHHGTGTVREIVAEPEHPVMKDYAGFSSWDETYVHRKHNTKDRVVLSYRQDEQGREPWTWVRTHGKGRVFYTAWGHDERTWGNPGFHNLLERGIRWASGGDPGQAGAFADLGAFPVPKMTAKRTDVKPFEYVPAKIAFYPPDARGKGDGSWNKMQLPVDPAESMKHTVVPEGFEVRLFAAEPQIGKPLCMNWDERGRLWIAETLDYPNELKPEGQGRDRIKVLEDTDGDGVADRFTVFADNLSIPTSIAFSRGGIVVQQAPHTLFLRDNDGDGKADEKRVLFSGWGTGDTHAGPSNLRYGLDNWLWGIVGYSGFRGTVGGEDLRFGQGFYRFRPDGSKFEFVRSTNNNSWGVGFSEEGILFGSTANRNPSVYMPIPNRYYESVRGWSASTLGTIADTHLFHAITDKVRQVDHHGGYTAGAGHALYTARTYPEPYWNRTAFVAEPTGHLVGTFVLAPDGSDFHSTNPFNLFASDDEWCAPTMAEVGPDGHVWMIDWYNYIVQHNPTPVGFKTGKGGAYETDLRDKRHARIYRLVFKGAKPSQPLTLAGAAPATLVAMLKNDNMLWRLHAQRLLVERGEKDVVPALVALVREPSADAIDLNAAAIHALWTLQGLGALDGSNAEAVAAATAALKHRSAGVRQNAVKVLPRTAATVALVLKSDLLDDADAQVRLATLLALAELPPSGPTGPAVAAALRQPVNLSDRWIPEAVTSAAAANAAGFLETLASAQTVSGRERSIVAIVAEHYARGGPSETTSQLLAALAGGNATVAEAAVEGLAKGWPKGRPARLDDRGEKALATLLKSLPAGTRGTVVRLASALGSKNLEQYGREISESLFAAVGDAKQSEAQRVESARQLIGFRPADPQAVAAVLEQVSARTAPGLAAGLIEVLGASESEAVGTDLVKRLPSLTPSAKAAAVRVLLQRPKATSALLDGLTQGSVSVSDLSLDQKQALAVHPDDALRRRARELLAKGGGLPNADRQKVIDELAPVVLRKADAARGKVVFKEQCAKCHTHGGEGGKVGPDLTGMAVHPKEELLVHILDPSRSVEGNFKQYSVATKDGIVLTGVLTGESKTAIELGDAEGKPHVVQRDDIEELVASPKSLMPEGFEKQVPPADIANVLEFLTQRGKYVPLDLSKVATAVSTRGMFYSEDSDVERLVFPDWKPKTFDGVPFQLVDPRGDRVPNVVLLYSPNGAIPPRMPRSVSLPCHAPVKAIHLLSGVSGWGYPASDEGTVSLIVRLHYADGKTEDHPLRNGVEFADYIRPVDVAGSKLAFHLRGQQVRFLSVQPKRPELIERIELVKGRDQTAPIVMAVTLETAE
ncbi:MAG: ThuA domain-containing protein [Isosphaeraceae bacterium]|nr:ThuA domain-containing protein [Isosphaeraceae bacterium]